MGFIVAIGELDILDAGAVSEICTVRAKSKAVTEAFVLRKSVGSFDIYRKFNRRIGFLDERNIRIPVLVFGQYKIVADALRKL